MSNPSLKWFWAYWAFLMVFTAYSRPLATTLRKQGLLAWTLLGLGLFILIAAVLVLRKQRHKTLEWRPIYLGLGIAVLFGISYFVFYAHNAPLEEYLHIAMFGLPGFILNRQTLHTPNHRLLFFALALVIGVADEIWQYFLPDRFFDVRDIIANVGFALSGWWIADGIVLSDPE